MLRLVHQQTTGLNGMTKIEAIEELDLLIDAAHMCSDEWVSTQWALHNAEIDRLNAIINFNKQD